MIHPSELLELISIEDVIAHYGEADLLQAIGEDTAVRHFDLEEIIEDGHKYRDLE